MASSGGKTLIIRDELHGDMSFDSVLQAAIDHPYFQRLRFIKQLGLAEYVFPCGTHTRFQHSLGAAYLAGQYFDSLIRAWSTSPFHQDGADKQTLFFFDRTRKAVDAVTGHRASEHYWRQVTRLSGLLHDVGHGPWSHTFEMLGLKHDFKESLDEIPGAVGKSLRASYEKTGILMHEDLSLLYVFHILKDLEKTKEIESAQAFFAPIASLVHRKLSVGELREEIEADLTVALTSAGIQGGLDFHHLLRPIISGPFDVDRMDYIQRDGRNCGVHIAGIEWRRIMSKIVPCLAHYPGAGEDEPSNVVLISNIKNQHVIEDFIFTLFQMYAQVYLHPKVVGFEEMIQEVLEKNSASLAKFSINFEKHASLSDESFRKLLTEELKMKEIEKILFRTPGYLFEVERYPAGSGMEDELKRNQFRLIDHLDRPMLKDSVGIFLYSSIKQGGEEQAMIRPWKSISAVAKQFAETNYTPNLWIRWSK